MKRALRLTMELALLVVLSACSGSTTPTAPSARANAATPAPPTVPNPAPRSTLQGAITITEISAGSGATLAVRDCDAGNVMRICTDQWRGTFDVVTDRDVSFAVLAVRFYDGQMLCGYGAATRELVPAGSVVSFATSKIYVSDEFGTFARPCRLPATTTRIVATLWTDNDWNSTLIQEFSNTYTFAEP